MKKTLSTILALVMALGLVFGCVSFAAAEPTEFNALRYLMDANADWSAQYWGEDVEGVTPINAEVTGEGTYTVGMKFAAPSAGLAFAAVGIKSGETCFPGYTIEITAIRVNGEPVEFKKGYTSSDDGLETRMNIYNEWVSEVPADARSFDGKTDDVAPIIVDKEAFAAVDSVEVDFVFRKNGVDTAYIMYADGAWAYQYWNADAEGVTATNAKIEGFGDYTAGL